MYISLKRFVLLLFFLFCQNQQNAQALAPQNQALKRELSIVPAMSSRVVEDSSNAWTIEQVLSPTIQEKFEKENQPLDYNQNKASTYWKQLKLENRSDHGTWLLEFTDPHIEYLKLYIVQDGYVKEFPATGYGFLFDTRTIPHKNYVFEVGIPMDKKIAIYAKIYAHSRFCGFSSHLRSVQNYSGYFFAEYHLLGLYYGIILILVVYNFILGFFVHEKVHFYYCLYTVCCALFTYAEDGLAIQWLWPNHPLLNIFLIKIAPLLLLFSFLLYSDRFIELRMRFPIVQRYIFFASFAYILAHYVFDGPTQITYLLYILPFMLTCISSIRVYKNGFRPARFFVVGNSMIVLSLLVSYLRLNGWIGSNVFTVYIFNYAFVFEAIVLSISLADKVKTTKIQSEMSQKETIRQLRINDELQQKVNKELETKVQERTRDLTHKSNELQEANQKLELLKKQLYEMNSKMDINIWELKKEVKKETEARILNNIVPYEEFASIFPEHKCYQYLKDLKWKDGFICPKCGNTKFGRGNNAYTYKCTQCQHQESVTSNTLFHGVKFPITKAFYLAYFLTRNTGKVTYEELGALLELNKNTVWNFDKKLKESLKQGSKRSHAAIPEWDKLLLSKS